jgi:hypothetical protein
MGDASSTPRGLKAARKVHMQKKELAARTEQISPNTTRPAASPDERGRNERRDAPLSDGLRREIEKAAYYRAQARGFAPGYEVQDWLEAEEEVLKRSAKAT